MKIKVYQIDSEKDERKLGFRNYEDTQIHGGIRPTEYQCVFDGYVEAGNLEDVYAILNSDEHPGTYRGYSLSVSDIVEVEGDISSSPAPAYSGSQQTGMFFCDSFGFRKIDFDGTQAAPLEGIRCLEIQPGKPPFETRIPDKLLNWQRAVSDHGEDSLIEITYPFDDNAVIVSNEEAKLIGMAGNRRVDGEIYAGPMFIVGNADSEFCDLTDKQIYDYGKQFAEPEDIPPEEVQSDCGFTFYGC